MGGLASINILFNVDLKSLSTDLQNSVREVRKYGDAMKDVGGSLSTYVTAPLVAASVVSGKFASDMQESQNKVSVAFKESSKEVERFAETTLDRFGIAEGSALDMAALFGDMATSMGLPRDEAAKLSTSLVGLAGDLASFKNIGIDQATTALNGVFTGETESLKMLGIVMTEANLQQFALSKGVTKNIKDFTQAEKVQLRYAYVMQQTSNAQGDFARTGGGAANQARVFQEGMKELAVMFGEVLLPAFTSAIKYVNGVISALKEMDPAWRDTIVIVGAVAASVGPLVYGLGAAAKAYVNMAVMAEKAAAALAANPYTAIAVVLAAIATTALVATSRFTPLTNAAKEFNEVMQSGADSIAKETAELNKNLAVARNEQASKEKRTEAIQNLNAISPEYLGNLTLENINTKEATTATQRYTEALKAKARVMAAQEKLVDVEKKLLDLQLGQADAVKPSVWQNLANGVLATGNAQKFAQLSGQSLFENYVEQNSELNKLQKKLIEFIGVNDKYTKGQQGAAGETFNLNKALKDAAQAGTIKYYEGLIADLKKLQTETVTTSSAYSKFQEQIDAYQAKIDGLQGKRKPVESVVPETLQTPKIGLSDDMMRVKELEAQRDRFLEAQKGFLKGTESFEYLQKRIDGLDFTINMAVDPASMIKTGKDLEAMLNEYDATLAAIKEIAMSAKDAVVNAFESMAGRFVESLGLAADGAQGFLKVILQTVIQLISMMLAQSISQAIAGATASGTATGPAAAFTTPAFIATAVSGVIAAFAAIPKFETGGIVGGSSFFGDKLLARVNSGEAIFNQEQQRSLWSQLNPAVSAGDMIVQLMGGFEIDGTKLRLVLDRSDKNDKRKK